jgi:hypothetical protein
MTHPTLYRAARAATAIASMAAFAAVFLQLPASGVLVVGLFCTLMLFATVWVGRLTELSMTEALGPSQAAPVPVLVTAVDGAASLPRPRPVYP